MFPPAAPRGMFKRKYVQEVSVSLLYEELLERGSRGKSAESGDTFPLRGK